MAYKTLEDALVLGHGTERQFCCHVHHETNASASVNVLNGLWICYACGARGKVDTTSIKISPSTVQRQVNRAVKAVLEEERVFYSDAWLSLYDGAGPGEYWLSRFDPQTAQHFRLGQDPLNGAATYPMRDDRGRVLGIVRRNLQDGPKYRYPYDVDVSKHMFNYHQCSADSLVITEGATDVMAAYEAGYDAVAIYSAHLSNAQAQLIRRYNPKRIWVATDQDPAGDSAWMQIKAKLPELDVRRLRWDEYKDLSAMPLAARALALEPVSRVGSVPCESYPSTSRITLRKRPLSPATFKRVTIMRRPLDA
jgi:5S rRNA maturation endonuclease (ribonuclease M5)